MYRVTRTYIRGDESAEFYVISRLTSETISWMASQPGFMNHTYTYSSDNLTLTRIIEFTSQETFENMVSLWLANNPEYNSEFETYNAANGHVAANNAEEV